MRGAAATDRHPAGRFSRHARGLPKQKKRYAGRDKFRVYFENAPIAMVLLARDGAVSKVNLQFSALFGYDEALLPNSDRWFAMMFPDQAYREAVRETWNHLPGEAEPSETRTEVLRVVCNGGAEKTVRFKASRTTQGEWVVTCEDIGESIVAEEAVRSSEEKYRYLYEKSLRADELYRSLVKSCRDAIVIYDMEGRAKYVNDSFTEIFGWTLEEVEGKKLEYVPPSESEVTQSAISSVVNDGEPNCGFETRRLTKDGRVLDVRISASRYHDHQGNPAGMLVIATDVTDRRRQQLALAQSEKQLRRLSSQLLGAQENERKRVAQELHDGIGQSLTAIKFRLENTFNQAVQCGDAGRGEDMAKILPLVQSAIEEVRRISMDLRPSILDDLGVLATVNWFCREFQATFPHISVGKEVLLTEEEIPHLLKVVVFRVLQEALNNVAKHSGADRVLISLKRASGAIELAISDNGIGLDWSAAFDADRCRKGFGLASMKERTESSGGTLAIERGAGAWTVLRASWPENGIGFTRL